MPYRYIGTTYDGIRIIAPKTKSKRFTRAEVRAAIRETLAGRQREVEKKLQTTVDGSEGGR